MIVTTNAKAKSVIQAAAAEVKISIHSTPLAREATEKVKGFGKASLLEIRALPIVLRVWKRIICVPKTTPLVLFPPLGVHRKTRKRKLVAVCRQETKKRGF